jgi:hypothetical protein
MLYFSPKLKKNYTKKPRTMRTGNHELAAMAHFASKLPYAKAHTQPHHCPLPSLLSIKTNPYLSSIMSQERLINPN